MTIDEAIYYESSIDRTGCERRYTKIEHEQLAEWLKKLKAYEESLALKTEYYAGYERGYADGVDDFAKKITDLDDDGYSKNCKAEFCEGNCSKCVREYLSIARKLKEGGENDN